MESPEKTLSDNLASLVEGPADVVSIRIMVERVGDKGFGILLVVLSLPSALPVPAPGYSTPFGILLALLGIQMIAGRTTPWLPKKALDKEVSREFAGKMVRSANRFLHFTERVVRPRMRWINTLGGRIFLGVVVLCMALLMTLPIPLTNTGPAIVIFCIGVSISEDDGLAAIGSFLLGILAAAFYAYIIYLLLTVGMDGVIQLKEWIKGLLFGSGAAQ